MKNIFFVLFLFTSIAAFNAQVSSAETKSTSLRDLPNGNRTDEGAKVPEIVKINFDKAYPKNIAAWTIEDKRYMAEYKDTLHIGHIIVYDQYGRVLAVQDEMSPGAFPVPIDKYIVERYPNQHFTIWSMVNADGTNLYYFTRETETIWFDPTGKFRNKTVNKLK
ncbi:MAG: hypothetical protein V4635_02135 [Bacteroidota bacterium]